MNISETIDNYRAMYRDVPKDDYKAIQWIISRIKHNTPATSAKRLSRKCENLCNGVVCEDTLDSYYVNMINDTLNEIRLGKRAYLFNLEQIREIVRFEPHAEFTYLYNSDCFCVTVHQ